MQVLSSPASVRLKALYPVDYSVSKHNKPDNIPATDRVTIRFAGNTDFDKWPSQTADYQYFRTHLTLPHKEQMEAFAKSTGIYNNFENLINFIFSDSTFSLNKNEIINVPNLTRNLVSFYNTKGTYNQREGFFPEDQVEKTLILEKALQTPQEIRKHVYALCAKTAFRLCFHINPEKLPTLFSELIAILIEQSDDDSAAFIKPVAQLCNTLQPNKRLKDAIDKKLTTVPITKDNHELQQSLLLRYLTEYHNGLLSDNFNKVFSILLEQADKPFAVLLLPAVICAQIFKPDKGLKDVIQKKSKVVPVEEYASKLITEGSNLFSNSDSRIRLEHKQLQNNLKELLQLFSHSEIQQSEVAECLYQAIQNSTYPYKSELLDFLSKTYLETVDTQTLPKGKKPTARQVIQEYLTAATPESRTVLYEKAMKDLGSTPLELAQQFPPPIKGDLKPNHLMVTGFIEHGEKKIPSKDERFDFNFKEGSVFIIYPNYPNGSTRCIPNKVEIHDESPVGIHLTDVPMHHFDVKDGTWRNIVFQNVRLADNVFRNTHFNQLWAENNHFFEGISFPETTFENFYLAGNQLKKVNFYNTQFKQGFIAHNDFDECDFNRAKFERICFVDSDFSTSRHLGKAEFKDCTYLEGHEPIFPNDVSPETLGILKEKDPSRHPEISLPQNSRFVLSHISHKDFADLPDKDTQRLFSYLAAQQRMPNPDQESSVHTGPTLRKLRESFHPKPENTDLSLYEPPSRNPRQSDESGIINLRLDTYPLTTKDGNLYFDLNKIKDTCLAQQLYSMYHQSQSDGIQAAYWMKRLIEAYGMDFNRVHGNGGGWEIPQDRQQEFIHWLKKRYRLYEGEFTLKKTLQAVMPPGKLDGLSAIIGGEEYKEQLIRKIIAPLIFPAINAFADSMPANGWIFHGPPGTGKSFIPKQLSRQLGLTPVVVTLGSIGSGYENQTVQNLLEQFETALRLAKQHGISVMLLDEADQLGSHRRKAGSGSKADVGNALLNNYTRYIEEGDVPIIVIGTTNSLRNLDPALRSRLRNELEIGLPDEASRRALIEQALPQSSGSFFHKHEPYEGGREKLIEFMTDKSRGLSVRDLSQLIESLTTGYHHNISQQQVLQEIKTIHEKKRAEVDKKVGTVW